jgi:ubiquinone/menaquinone biosynthesis C-methylase UbiE
MLSRGLVRKASLYTEVVTERAMARGASGEGPWELGLQLLGGVEGYQVLDLAAGGGYFSRRLAEDGAIVTACDLVDQWDEPEIRFRLIDMDERWPFEDGSFDAVAIIEALNYAGSPRHIFREAYRVLRPGGAFVATFPNCMSLESRTKFLLTGTYRWFPHPVYLGGGKERYHDVGRDPIRPTTAKFELELTGFQCEEVAYGSTAMGRAAAIPASFILGLARLQNKLRNKPEKQIPIEAMTMDSMLRRNAGVRARKPT